MSKFNHKAVAAAVQEYKEVYGEEHRGHKAVKKTTNLAGGEAYRLSPEMELYVRVCTMGLADKYYESENTQMTELRRLIDNSSPSFIAKMAIYAREKMYLRTIPLVLTVELANLISTTLSNYPNKSLISRLVSRVIKRADEITEILAYYQTRNHRTGQTKKLNKLSNQLKKGIRQIFESGVFDEYQFAKYNRNTEVKLRDALFLTHPKPQDKTQKDIFDKIVNDTLETPYTWETQLSEAGKSGRSKKEVWEELIDSGRLGYMAMLRNLRNILSEDVSGKHIDIVCDTLSDKNNVLKSKQLPFRFLSAYRSLISIPPSWSNYSGINITPVDSIYLGKVLDALEKAVSYSVNNLPILLNNNVLISTDVSGSMITKLNDKSIITYFDIGALMCMIANKASSNSIASMFGTNLAVLPVGKSGILQSVQNIYEREGQVGYSTNGYKVLQYANKSKTVFDRIMIFTDCQMYGGSINQEWEKYKKKNPNAKLYIFNLAGYNTSPIKIEDNGVYMLSGWSDKVFDVLYQIENGKNALDEINSIEL